MGLEQTVTSTNAGFLENGADGPEFNFTDLEMERFQDILVGPKAVQEFGPLTAYTDWR